MAIDKAVDSGALDAAMTYTAARIRAKTGSTDRIVWDTAKGFGDKVDAIPTGEVKISTQNLHDTTTDTDGYYLNNGTVVSYAGWSITDFIPVTKGTLYSLTGKQASLQYSFFYDDGQQMLQALGNLGGGLSTVDNSYILVRAPENGFMRLSGPTSAVATVGVFACSGSIGVSDA